MTDIRRDAYGRLNAHRSLWQEAKTLEAAGELMAQWLLGEIEYQPLNFGSTIDEETKGIAATLAAINRAGFLTDQSQPGLVVGSLVQREFVTGRCTAEVAALLIEVGTTSELVVVTHAPGTSSEAVIPVSQDSQGVYTTLGAAVPFEAEYDVWVAETNRDLADELAKCWYVEAFDPAWGRSGTLLPAVLTALQP